MPGPQCSFAARGGRQDLGRRSQAASSPKSRVLVPTRLLSPAAVACLTECTNRSIFVLTNESHSRRPCPKPTAFAAAIALTRGRMHKHVRNRGTDARRKALKCPVSGAETPRAGSRSANRESEGAGAGPNPADIPSSRLSQAGRAGDRGTEARRNPLKCLDPGAGRAPPSRRDAALQGDDLSASGAAPLPKVRGGSRRIATSPFGRVVTMCNVADFGAQAPDLACAGTFGREGRELGGVTRVRRPLRLAFPRHVC